MRRLAALLLGVVAAAGVWLAWSGLGPSAGGASGLESSKLPDRCDVELAANLPTLFARPEFKEQNPDLALGGVLGSAKGDLTGITSAITELTRSGKMEDVSVLRACVSRNRSDFAVAVYGNIRPDALTRLEAKGWKKTPAAGDVTAFAPPSGTPLFVQARDTSLLVASSMKELGRALSGSRRPAEIRSVPERATLWAVLGPASNSGGPAATPLAAYEKLTIVADLESQKARAIIESKNGEAAALAGSQVRALLNRARSSAEAGGGKDAFSYLLQRATLSTNGSATVVETELDERGAAWLARELAERLRPVAGRR